MTKKEIYTDLLQRIMTNELGSGEQLFEKELMEQYGVGRTPLREILQDLQRDGLVEIIPKLGTRVMAMDLRTLRETVQLRRELEGLAAGLAAANISAEQFEGLLDILAQAAGAEGRDLEAMKELAALDFEFQHIIHEAADNRQLKELLRMLANKMCAYWFQIGFTVEDYQAQFQTLHELCEALEARDQEAARAIAQKRIDHFTQLVRQNLF